MSLSFQALMYTKVSVSQGKHTHTRLFLWWGGRERINLLAAGQWFRKIEINIKGKTASKEIKSWNCASKIVIAVFWVAEKAVSSNYSHTCYRPSAHKFHSIINGKQMALYYLPFIHWPFSYELFFSSKSCSFLYVYIRI